MRWGIGNAAVNNGGDERLRVLAFVGLRMGDPVRDAILGAHVAFMCGRRVVVFCHSNEMMGEV